jgi:flagellar hook-associated protein 2
MTISIDGLISGLDTTGIITKLMELERRPIRLLEAKQDNLDSELLAWQELNTKILSFETAAQKINTSGEFQAMSASFRNSNSQQGDIVNLTVNSNVPASIYSLQVSRLATQHKMVSNEGFSSITENVGYTSVTITTAGGASETFTQGTLSELRNAINSSSLGITANIVNTSGSSTPNYRLMLSSKEVGSDESFTVSVNQGSAVLTFSVLQQAQDAALTLDGISITRSDNSFNDLIEGVEIELTAAGSGTVTIGSNSDTIVENIEEFVDAYNKVMNFIREQFAFNTETNETKPLFGNSTLLGIQSSLSNMVTGIVKGLIPNSDPYATLSQVGIKTDSVNRLTVDKNLLVQALTENPDAVKNLFVPVASGSYTFVSATGATVAGDYDTRVIDQSGTPVIQMRLQGSSEAWITLEQSGNFWFGPDGGGLEGFGIRAVNISVGDTGTMRISIGVAEQVAYRTGFITEFSTEGAIFNQRRSLETRKSEFQKQIEALELRINKKQETLTNKYVRLEVALAQLQSQSDYLTQQLDNLPGYLLSKK